MGRHYSFDDRRVGKGDGEFFKVTGTKDRPQRIAYIPCEAYEHQLVVSPELRQRAARRDVQAIEEIEDIGALREEITKSMKKQTPSAEVWTNEQGTRVILYAKTEGARTFWIDGIGYVYFKEGIPEKLLDKPPQVVYGLVVLEYELDSDNEPVLLSPDRQVDLGEGHKLTFKYDIKAWSINDAKTRSWKEHSRTNPVIKNDYLVWAQKEGQYDRTKFSPAGPALWRQNPAVMNRIIKEARQAYENLPRTIAKDLSVDDIVEMLGGGGQRGRRPDAAQATVMPEEIDFSDLLGRGTNPVTAPERVALEHGSSQPSQEFPDLGSGMEHLLESSPRDGGSPLG